jgi:hypothetical protein
LVIQFLHSDKKPGTFGFSEEMLVTNAILKATAPHVLSTQCERAHDKASLLQLCEPPKYSFRGNRISLGEVAQQPRVTVFDVIFYGRAHKGRLLCFRAFNGLQVIGSSARARRWG